MTTKGVRGGATVHTIGWVEYYIAAAIVLYVLSGYIRFYLLPKRKNG